MSAACAKCGAVLLDPSVGALCLACFLAARRARRLLALAFANGEGKIG